jgi:hypothetical protein
VRFRIDSAALIIWLILAVTAVNDSATMVNATITSINVNPLHELRVTVYSSS